MSDEKIKSFYLQRTDDSSDVYELHATTDISVNYSSSVTSFPVSDRRTASDNVVINPITITLRGVVTDVKQSSSLLSYGKVAEIFSGEGEAEGVKEKTSEEYINDLIGHIEGAQLFDVYLPTVEPLEKCIITNFSINKSASYGGDSWMVSLDIQQVREATLTVSAANPAEPYRSLLAGETGANGSGTGVDGEQAENACKQGGNQICSTGRTADGKPYWLGRDGKKYF